MFALKKTQEDTLAFFGAISERKLSDAERMLGAIELGLVFYKNQIDNNSQKNRKIGSTKRIENSSDYIVGYIKALEGILAASRASDERAFMNRNSQDLDILQSYRRKFAEFKDDELHSVFDRGFMSAWLDFVNYRTKAFETKKERKSMR